MTTIQRIKPSQVPQVRAALLKRQDYRCGICQTPLKAVSANACLDHDHTTGHIRGVLCRNCNGIEGKIKNLVTRGRKHYSHADYLGRIIMYWLYHQKNPLGLFHPVHKTDDEKRELRNKKARLARARKKTV